MEALPQVLEQNSVSVALGYVDVRAVVGAGSREESGEK